MTAVSFFTHECVFPEGMLSLKISLTLLDFIDYKEMLASPRRK